MDQPTCMPSHAPRKMLVAVFGLSDYELRLLRSILSLTNINSRKYCYALQEQDADQCPDIAIVDPDNAHANAAFQTLATKPQTAVPATLYVARHTQPSPYKHCLPRPLAATKMLALLDEMAGALPPPADIVPQQSYAAVNPPSTAGNEVPAPLTASITSVVPQAETAPEIQARIPSQPAPIAMQKPGFRALVVDDSPTVRTKIDLALRFHNVATDCVETGEQALEMLGKTEYDLVFLDIVLPGADGYEVCRAIKHRHGTKRLPVIMLTSKSSPFDRIRGSLAGCSTYLIKPVENVTFHEVVEKYLAVAREQHAAAKLQGNLSYA